MRILYVTQTFPPEPGSTQRPLRQAVCLKQLGCDVTVLTTMPSYPTGRIHSEYRWKWFAREKIEGVEVVRVWSVPAPNRGKWRRLISWMSFAIAASLVGLFRRRYDLVVASVPNLGTEIAGIAIAKSKGSRLLLELRDVLPDNLVLVGIAETSFCARVLRAYFTLIYRMADLIAIPNHSMRTVLEERGVSSGRILLLPHAADLDQLDRENGEHICRAFHLAGRFVALYAGSFSCYYDVPNIVRAATLLRNRLPSFHLMLLGVGPDWRTVGRMIEQNGLVNVTLIGAVAPEAVGPYLQAADLFIYPLRPGRFPKTLRDSPTTKLCEYLMVGRPVIAVDDGVVCGDFLERIGAGIGIPGGQPHVLADAIVSFALNQTEAMRCGRNARQYAQAHLDRRKVVEKFYGELMEKLQGGVCS